MKRNKSKKALNCTPYDYEQHCEMNSRNVAAINM